jgi:gluconate 2-dehydrogenase gamma chain
MSASQGHFAFRFAKDPATGHSLNTARATRRDFLADVTRTAAAGALACQLPMLTTLAGCTSDAERFVRLTPAEVRTARAFAAQILPSESDSPGAEEAGVVYFIDRALGAPFFADMVPVIRSGLADLDARARAAGVHGGFSALSDAGQTAMLRRIADGPFFSSARTLVLIGAFADPFHGGNRGGAGLRMMAMEHRPTYSAPFGWYDAQPSAEPAAPAT